MNRRHPKGPALCSIAAVLFSLYLLPTGCSLVRMESVTVTEWAPEETAVEDIRSCTVSMTFSADMDRARTEEAFTLTGAGGPVEGKCSWEGSTMVFTPFTPLLPMGEYVMELSKTAEDTYGNNLETDFFHTFSGASENVRPSLANHSPEDGSLVEAPRTPIVLEFSESISRGSLYENFSISPDPGGRYTWNGEDRVCTFTPNEGLTAGEEYTVTVGADTADRNGNTLGTDTTFTFFIGSDQEAPKIDFVGSERNPSIILTEDIPDDSLMTVTVGWECSWNILIRFNEAMDRAATEPAIEIDPAGDFSVEQISTSEWLVNFETRPDYDTLHTLTIGGSAGDTSGNPLGTDRIYRFRTDGPGSLPPEIVMVSFSGSAGNPAGIRTLHAFDNLTLRSGLGATEEYFDLYVKTASGASLLKKSVIDNFSVSSSNTAGCFSISLTGIELSPAPPDPPPGPDETVVRVHASIETFTDPGIMSMKMESSFADSLGNPMNGEWIMQINVINN